MSFVPLSGAGDPARRRRAARRRGGVHRRASRTITLPIRAALPVLAKARTDERPTPPSSLLAAASLLGDALRRRRQVRARRGRAGGSPRSTPTTPSGCGGWPSRARTPGCRRPTPSTSYAASSTPSSTPCRARPRPPRRPRPATAPPGPRPARGRRVQPPPPGARPRHRGDAADLPQLVDALAPGGGRRGGARRRAPAGWSSRSTTSRTRSTCATPRSLWHDAPSVHGFGDRARTHASLALRERGRRPGRRSTGCSSSACPTR